ncbi:MAG: DUF72 domain-containing protein [Planctomycetota bacterium]|nr:DUF72 domain-containing protein [Planctomycetota bacterium]
MSQTAKYYLGCPVWACEHWKGKLYPRNSRRGDWLPLYSQAFGTVEGNATFYGLPTISTVQKWASQTEDGFRFALKFPRSISHECRLAGARAETDLFCECLEILLDADRLGPSFLQLPPDFGGEEFFRLEEYLRALPEKFPVAVEVRHGDYFQDPFKSRLLELLCALKMDRVIFDSRALFHFPPGDLTESEARRRKPKVPILKDVTGEFPFVRLVGINRIEKLDPWIEEWTNELAGWIRQGKTPYLFTHTPNDAFAPEFARKFHLSLQDKVEHLAPLPEWKGKGEQQMDLF